MVTLHYLVNTEDEDILADMKYIQIYDDNEADILGKRKEFESNLDIQITLDIYRKLCRENNDDDDNGEIQDVVNRFPEPNPFEQLYNNLNSELNKDL